MLLAQLDMAEVAGVISARDLRLEDTEEELDGLSGAEPTTVPTLMLNSA